MIPLEEALLEWGMGCFKRENPIYKSKCKR
jgi:hypothetical protein